MNINFMWIIFRELIKWTQCQYQQMHKYTVYIANITYDGGLAHSIFHVRH